MKCRFSGLPYLQSIPSIIEPYPAVAKLCEFYTVTHHCIGGFEKSNKDDSYIGHVRKIYRECAHHLFLDVSVHICTPLFQLLMLISEMLAKESVIRCMLCPSTI